MIKQYSLVQDMLQLHVLDSANKVLVCKGKVSAGPLLSFVNLPYVAELIGIKDP